MKVRVIKKGKTRGRPSKEEIAMTKVVNWWLEKNPNKIIDEFLGRTLYVDEWKQPKEYLKNNQGDV